MLNNEQILIKIMQLLDFNMEDIKLTQTSDKKNSILEKKVILNIKNT